MRKELGPGMVKSSNGDEKHTGPAALTHLKTKKRSVLNSFGSRQATGENDERMRCGTPAA